MATATAALRIPEDLANRYDRLAKSTGRTKNFYMTEALAAEIGRLEYEYGLMNYPGSVWLRGTPVRGPDSSGPAQGDRDGGHRAARGAVGERDGAPVGARGLGGGVEAEPVVAASVARGAGGVVCEEALAAAFEGGGREARSVVGLATPIWTIPGGTAPPP